MISVNNLSKFFGDNRAVNDISFEVERGEVLGFLGPNGAGKSTTMRILTGFLPASSGTVHIDGFNVADHPIDVKRLIGYLPESAPAYPDMTVYNFLKFSGEVRGMKGKKLNTAIEKVVDTCYLHGVRHQNIDTLSKGYRHRTCLAQSIIHDPEVIIMDEPTDGLDPNQKHGIRSLIKEMGSEKAVIFSTHILEEVEAVCTRIIVINEGELVANDTPDKLKQLSPNAGSLLIELSENKIPALIKFLRNNNFSEGLEHVIQPPYSLLRIKLNEANNEASIDGYVEKLTQLLSNTEFRIRQIYEEDGDMQEVFRKLTIDKNADS